METNLFLIYKFRINNKGINNMDKYNIYKIFNKSELKEEAAEWFHSKWGIPVETYQESIEDSLKEGSVVPSWYVCMDGDKIVGGMGVLMYGSRRL